MKGQILFDSTWSTWNRQIHKGRKWIRDYQEVGEEKNEELLLNGTEFLSGVMEKF